MQRNQVVLNAPFLTVKPSLWFELLSEYRGVVIGQHSSIQGVHSLPLVRRGTERLPIVPHCHPVEHQQGGVRGCETSKGLGEIIGKQEAGRRQNKKLALAVRHEGADEASC